MTFRNQTSGAGDSPAKISAQQDDDVDSQQEHDPALHSGSLTLWNSDDLTGSCLRTSLGSLHPIAALTSPDFSTRWSNSGTASRGGFLTLRTSESPNEGAACLLSEILEPTAPQRFYLSARAASGILRRAGRRGKVLPPELHQALESLGNGTSESAARIRRLTPTECERLMGYPDGWTISAAWTHSAQQRTERSKRGTGRAG